MNIVIGLESTFFIFDPIIFLSELIETPISLTVCTNIWKETSYLISKKYSRIFSLVLLKIKKIQYSSEQKSRTCAYTMCLAKFLSNYIFKHINISSGINMHASNTKYIRIRKKKTELGKMTD